MELSDVHDVLVRSCLLVNVEGSLPPTLPLPTA
jgi:hypothetical protein